MRTRRRIITFVIGVVVLAVPARGQGTAPAALASQYVNEREGLAVLVVEQNAVVALDATARAYVLEVGKVAVEGTSADLQRDEAVRRSYLGY